MTVWRCGDGQESLTGLANRIPSAKVTHADKVSAAKSASHRREPILTVLSLGASAPPAPVRVRVTEIDGSPVRCTMRRSGFRRV